MRTKEKIGEKIWTVYLIEYQGVVKYVGKTCDFKRRVYEHRGARNTNSSAIPTDIDLNDVTFIPLDVYKEETDALKREDELICEYNTIDCGWNKNRSGKREKNKYYEEHKDVLNDKHRQYYNSHKQQIREYKRKWKQERMLIPEYREQARESLRKWREKQKERLN